MHHQAWQQATDFFALRCGERLPRGGDAAPEGEGWPHAGSSAVGGGSGGGGRPGGGRCRKAGGLVRLHLHGAAPAELGRPSFERYACWYALKRMWPYERLFTRGVRNGAREDQRSKAAQLRRSYIALPAPPPALCRKWPGAASLAIGWSSCHQSLLVSRLNNI